MISDRPDVVEALRTAVELMKDWRSAYLRLARGDSNVNELTFRITPKTNDLLDRLNAHHAPVRLSLPAAPAGLDVERLEAAYDRHFDAPDHYDECGSACFQTFMAAYAEGEPTA